MQEYYEKLSNSLKNTNNVPIRYIKDIKNSLNAPLPYKIGLSLPLRSRFLAELQYITSLPKKTHYILYVGGNEFAHIEMLVKLFPDIKFIIVNKEKIELCGCEIKQLHAKSASTINISPEEWAKTIIYCNNRVFTIEQHFDAQMAQLLGILHPILIHYYIIPENDEEILIAAAKQYYLVNLLQPSGYAMQFVPPRFDKSNIDLSNYVYEQNEVYSNIKNIDYVAAAQKFGLNYVENYNNRQFKHLEGNLAIFLFGAINGAATMLYSYVESEFIDRRELTRLHNYNSSAYYSALNYYAAISRCFYHCKNDYSMRQEGFDQCNECAAEAEIWIDYIQKTGRKIDIYTAVNSLSLCISKGDLKKAAHSLRAAGHGDFFDIKKEQIMRRINFIYIDPQKLNISDKKAASIVRPKYALSSTEILDIITKKMAKQERSHFLRSITKAFSEKPLYEDLKEVRDTLSAQIRMRPNASDKSRGLILSLIKYIYTSGCRVLAVIGPIYNEAALYTIFKLFKLPIIYINYGTRYNDHFYSLPEFQSENMTMPNIYKYTIGRELNKLAELKNIKELGLFLHMIDPTYFTEIHFGDLAEFYMKVIDITRACSYLVYFNPFCRNTYEYVPDMNTRSQKDTWPSFSFYKCDMWLVPYTNSWSPSIYLFGKAHKNKIQYNADDIKGRLSYYSQIYRAFNWFPNKYAGIRDSYDNCGDCSLEAHILDYYCKKYDKSFIDAYNIIDKNNPIYLKQRGHGNLTQDNKRDLKVIQKMFREEYLADILS